MAELAALAQKAMNVKDYTTAVTHLTAALKTNPNNPNPVWLIQRSTAYQRLSQHDLALIDAENAVVAGRARGKRDLIGTAQFRRGVSLYALKRFGDARLCFNWATKMNEKEKGVTMWMAKTKVDYDIAEAEDPQSAAVAKTVKEIPDKHEDINRDVSLEDKADKTTGLESKGKQTAGTAAAAVGQTQTTAKEKIRTEFFQSPTTVTISIFAKGVPKDRTEIIIEERNLEVRFPTSEIDIYDYTLSPLFQKINPSKSSYRVTPHKIEIILAKGVPGVKWAALEGDESVEAAVSAPSVPISGDKPPAYPTSSKKGPKDWDHLVDGEPDAEEADGDEMNSFFKKLYKDADDDTKRAMMKSYQESNGTALSTSWSDVSKKKVETNPPEGVEAKPW